MSRAKTKLKPKTPGGIVFNEPHLTKQDHGGTADVNYIASQYINGQLPYPEDIPAVYADIAGVDVAVMRDTLAALRSEFDILPSDARHFFNQDVEAYAEWIHQNGESIHENGFRQTLWEAVQGDNESDDLSPGTSPRGDADAASGDESAQNADSAAST